MKWLWAPRYRTLVLAASAATVLAIAIASSWTKPPFSLGLLYVFPVMLIAGFVPRWTSILLGAAPRNRNVTGHPIGGFLPALHYALRWEDGPQFRASMQCRGHRDNGQSFLRRYGSQVLGRTQSRSFLPSSPTSVSSDSMHRDL